MVDKLRTFVMSRRYDNNISFYVAKMYYMLELFYLRIQSPNKRISFKYKGIFGRFPNLDNPQTLNEKIQWLKLNDHKDFYTTCADKFEVRNWLKSIVDDKYLIPLIFHTSDYKDINPQNIKKYPCIVKANHSSKDFEILRNPESVDWNQLRRKCRWWMQRDYYMESLEWQYKNIKRQIVVEELLQTKEGKIPNDYKLHYFNGELKFVYVSVDREGENCRNIYDANWNPLYFDWSGTNKNAKSRRGGEINSPKSFDDMKKFGEIISANFPYVRIDYYDVNGKLYFGEITLHHGGGFDVFVPEEYDLKYGIMLKL